MAPLSKAHKGRAASATPPRAVFEDLGTAYASIIGRPQVTQGNLPLLPPDWACDQPATAGNLRSTPISAKARTSSQEALATSPLAGGSTQIARLATEGIPESDLCTRFPVASHEIRSDNSAWRPVQSNAGHRRSRSTGFLNESFAWYDAEYADSSTQRLDHSQHRFPSAPLNVDKPSRHDTNRCELPVFTFPNREIGDSFNNEEDRGRAHAIAATSTISDILHSYGDRSQPEDRVLEESPNSLNDMDTGHSRGRQARYHQHRRLLSQTAWSPQTSNGGMDIQYRHHSTHGEILNVVDEPHDTVQGFLQDVFQPRSDHENSRRRSSALAMLVRPNGETVSRPMSYAEMRTYENTVQTHIRHSLSPNIFDAEGYSYEGRLSLEYEQKGGRNLSDDSNYNPSSSSTSMSTWAGRQTEAAALRSNQQARQGHRDDDDVIGLQRRGTPPLLFGASGVDSNHSSTVLTNQEIADDGDWETVGDFSRHDTRGIAATQAHSSSFADYSSSSTGMMGPAGPPPGGESLGHPSHPRYTRTWNMFRDQRTGQTMLLPDSDVTQDDSIPIDRSIHPVQAQVLGRNYHHPSPLSEAHTNPFTSSPVTASQDSTSQYSVHDSTRSENGDHVLEMSPSVKKAVKLPKEASSGRDYSSAWISIDEGRSNTGAKCQESSLLYPKASPGNVTGTPEGTGAREVGSSIANASSPGVNFSSSPYATEFEPSRIRYPEACKQAHRSLSIDSNLSSPNSLGTEGSYWAARRGSHEQKNTDQEEYKLTALPSFAHISQEARFHRNQLIAHNLLPRDSPPQSKQQSLGLNYLTASPMRMKKAMANTGANLTRQIQQFVPNMAPLSAVRRRSPHRRDAQEDLLSSDIEMQSSDRPRGRRPKNHRQKNNTKSKVSDSEESVDSDVGLTPPSQPQTAANHIQHTEPSMSTSIQPKELEGARVHPTHTGISQVNATQQIGSAQNGSFQTAHGNTTEYNLRRLLDEPSVEEMLGAVRDIRPTPRVPVANRPVARASSPHLYPIPHPQTDALLNRQAVIGRLILLGCMSFPPICLLYAYGYLDCVMDWSCRGDVTEMPALEKKFALYYTPVSVTTIFAIVIWLLVTRTA